MDVKDLNKSQLIMLALLLSFVTSIATGITTVTLLQQAPSSVTVPINRVVRETVEKIVPVPGKNTVQTIVIKEEDLVVDAISKNKTAVFFISKESKDADGKSVEIDIGRGLAVSAGGMIAVDGATTDPNGVYYAKNESGKFKAEFVSKKDGGVSFLQLGKPIGEEGGTAVYSPIVAGDLSKLKIGQKILVWGSVISSFIFDGNKDFKIETAKSDPGALVLNLNGEVLGIALSGDTATFAPIDLILASGDAKSGDSMDGDAEAKVQ